MATLPRPASPSVNPRAPQGSVAGQTPQGLEDTPKGRDLSWAALVCHMRLAPRGNGAKKRLETQQCRPLQGLLSLLHHPSAQVSALFYFEPFTSTSTIRQ